MSGSDLTFKFLDIIEMFSSLNFPELSESQNVPVTFNSGFVKFRPHYTWQNAYVYVWTYLLVVTYNLKMSKWQSQRPDKVGFEAYFYLKL